MQPGLTDLIVPFGTSKSQEPAAEATIIIAPSAKAELSQLPITASTAHNIIITSTDAAGQASGQIRTEPGCGATQRWYAQLTDFHRNFDASCPQPLKVALWMKSYEGVQVLSDRD